MDLKVIPFDAVFFLLAGIAGLFIAARDGQWSIGALSGALVLASLRIIQLERRSEAA